MRDTFESQQGYGDDLEIGLDNFEFKSAGKKYINQNYKRIGAILGFEGEGLGVIKKQANRENKLPDIHGEIGLEQINFYRAHYDFSPLTQDEYETVKAQNTSSEAIIDEQVEEVTEVEKTDIDISSDEGEKVESIKTLTRKDFGPMPEDPYNIKNNDLQALNQLFNLKNNEFPNNQYVDIRNWSDWTPITVVSPEDINDPNLRWSITKGNNNELVGEFLREEDAEAEFKRIKDIDKQKALELLRKARNFAIGEDLESPWTDSVDVSIETPSPAAEAISSISASEGPAEDEGVAEDELPGAEALQAELDRLIEVEVAKLKREEIVENLSYKIDREKLETSKENARQAISNFQKFVRDHSSPADKSNHQIQEKYKLLEKQAWNSLYNLAHLLDGEIAILPQDRDIQLSHPGGVDTRQYLESRGYKFDENGDITHINDNGVEIELYRAMKTDSLIKSKRPSHVVYPNPMRSSLISNDISEGFQKNVSISANSSDRSWNRPIQNDVDLDEYNNVDRPTYYHSYITKGYLVKGLNQNTPDFITAILNQDMLGDVLVDEARKPNITTTEAVVPPATNPESPEQDEGGQMILSNKKNTVDFEVVDDPESAKLLEEMEPIDLVDRLAELREQYARAEEAWNRKPGDEKLEDTFIAAREAYNTELERVLKLQVAEGQADNISKMFKDEVMSLRDSRIEQSQELQGKWEKRLNPIKEKFVNFVIKHKKIISRLNLAAGVAGGALALTGVGIPLAGGLAVARRMVSATLLGVSTGEGIRSLGEDADINSFWGKIKFQAVIPKLVQESLASSEDEFKQVSEDVLKERLGTLEAYYRLNGGKFTSDNQQQAYEKVLTELARRVQENVIDVENPTISIQPLTTEQLERNRKLYGWGASYELAKIAKSQNVDLSLLSREDYADFAIQNKLMIEDTQLRMSPWQRMCESVDEVREGDKERQSLINPEADAAFDKFSLEMRQKAGEDNRNIDNNIIVRQGTNFSDHWLFFGINQGADSHEDQIFKSYISLQDLNTLTPDKFTDFMKALRDSGYNGDIKVFQDLLSQGIRLNDQIVMHGASEADAKLGLDVADQFFGDSLADKSLGIDEKISGKKYSYSQILAQKIKNSIQESNSVEEQSPSTEFVESDRQKLETDRYTSELLNTISDTRIAELDKFRRNRKIATGTGIVVGLLAGGAVHILDEVNKPDSVELTDSSGSPTGGSTTDTQGTGAGPGSSGEASAPEAGAGVTKPIPDASPAGTGAETTEDLRQQAAVAAANEAREVLAQDVSNLDSGETIWSQVSKWLGPDASQGQIQEAVEKYLGSIKGQDTIFKLAQQTEGGRELLSQWGIDNAGEMAGLSKEQLYEVSKYLGEGKLDGLTELSLDNLDALEQAEYLESSPVVEPTVEPGSTEPPAASSLEAQVETSYSELQPVETTEFNRSLSEALGATNLTEAQLQEIIHSFATSEQGSVDLYNQIISNEEGARFLSGFGVNNPADFTKLTQDQIYEIAQTIGVENLDQLQGFELNEIILSKFEDAPDMVELVRGTRPLDVVQRYIANEVGNLPYDTNLGKQVLDTYLQTDSGKQWLYDAIVNNPDINNQNIQYFKEYLRFKGITSPEEFVDNFNWAEFSGNRNIPTSGFWNQIRLPNGGTRLQPLSTFLQPSQMLGIKDALRQVLTK